MIRIVDGSLNRISSVNGQEIRFVTKDVEEVDKIIAENLGKPLQIKIEPIRKRRSVDANNYMWVLCDKIAKVIRSTKEEVYRRAIREVGVFSDVAVQRGEPLRNLITSWNGQGIGYFVEVFDSSLSDNKGEPMSRVRMYLGSHKYDTKCMSRLIDYIVEEAKELGIQTETPEQIARMKSLWGEKNG